jgi:hypothetical protein
MDGIGDCQRADQRPRVQASVYESGHWHPTLIGNLTRLTGSDQRQRQMTYDFSGGKPLKPTAEYVVV